MSEDLELEIRRKIYDLLEKNPGLHLSKISEILKLRISHVEYHLIYLEKNEIINTAKEKGYKRYYIAKSQVGTQEKKILSLLRQEIPLKIVLILLKKSKAKHGDIIKDVDIAPSTLSYHLKKLVKNNIITIIVDNGEKEYFVINKKEIIQIIIKYKPYKVLESFKDIWSYLQVD